jgi:hypothetical protein
VFAGLGVKLGYVIFFPQKKKKKRKRKGKIAVVAQK